MNRKVPANKWPNTFRDIGDRFLALNLKFVY